MKSSRLAVIKDKRFGEHKTPESHPESPARITAINNLVQRFRSEYDFLETREATEEEIASTHSPGYIEDLYKMSEVAINTDSLIRIDPDTLMSPRSYTTAKLAVGAALEGIDCLAKKNHDSCFVAVRPPGHHALADRAMGFCLFNNVAIAANQAKSKGFKRIFILDYTSILSGRLALAIGTSSAKKTGKATISISLCPKVPGTSDISDAWTKSSDRFVWTTNRI